MTTDGTVRCSTPHRSGANLHCGNLYGPLAAGNTYATLPMSSAMALLALRCFLPTGLFPVCVLEPNLTTIASSEHLSVILGWDMENLGYLISLNLVSTKRRRRRKLPNGCSACTHLRAASSFQKICNIIRLDHRIPCQANTIATIYQQVEVHNHCRPGHMRLTLVSGRYVPWNTLILWESQTNHLDLSRPVRGVLSRTTGSDDEICKSDSSAEKLILPGAKAPRKERTISEGGFPRATGREMNCLDGAVFCALLRSVTSRNGSPRCPGMVSLTTGTCLFHELSVQFYGPLIVRRRVLRLGIRSIRALFA